MNNAAWLFWWTSISIHSLTRQDWQILDFCCRTIDKFLMNLALYLEKGRVLKFFLDNLLNIPFYSSITLIFFSLLLLNFSFQSKIVSFYTKGKWASFHSQFFCHQFRDYLSPHWAKTKSDCHYLFPFGFN